MFQEKNSYQWFYEQVCCNKNVEMKNNFKNRNITKIASTI